MLVAGEAYDSETVSDIAEELGEFAVDLDWRVALTTMARIEATSGEAVRATVARLLKRERRVVGWCLPKKELARGKGSRRQRARARHARSFEIIDAGEEGE